MDNISSQKWKELKVRQSSNESLDCSSSVVSFEDDVKKLVPSYENNVHSEYSGPSCVNSNQTFDKFEVKQSKDVHIGTSYNCAAVHVYEANACNIKNVFKINYVTKFINY